MDVLGWVGRGVEGSFVLHNAFLKIVLPQQLLNSSCINLAILLWPQYSGFFTCHSNNFFYSRWLQVWRALRLIVDTGLHYVGMKRDEALKYFSDYAWDDTDLAKKEVRG